MMLTMTMILKFNVAIAIYSADLKLKIENNDPAEKMIHTDHLITHRKIINTVTHTQCIGQGAGGRLGKGRGRGQVGQGQGQGAVSLILSLGSRAGSAVRFAFGLLVLQPTRAKLTRYISISKSISSPKKMLTKLTK